MPADVFASANEKEMNAAGSEFLVKPGTIHDFAGNRLTVIFPRDNPGKIAVLKEIWAIAVLKSTWPMRPCRSGNTPCKCWIG